MKSLAATSYYQINIAIDTDNVERFIEALFRLYLIIGAILFLFNRLEIIIYLVSDAILAVEHYIKILQIIGACIKFA